MPEVAEEECVQGLVVFIRYFVYKYYSNCSELF